MQIFYKFSCYPTQKTKFKTRQPKQPLMLNAGNRATPPQARERHGIKRKKEKRKEGRQFNSIFRINVEIAYFFTNHETIRFQRCDPSFERSVRRENFDKVSNSVRVDERQGHQPCVCRPTRDKETLKLSS